PFGIPEFHERADRVAEIARAVVLRPFEEDETLLRVVADDLDGIAVAGFEILVGGEAEPERDRRAPVLVVVAQHALASVGGTGRAFFREMQRPTETPPFGDEDDLVVLRHRDET